MSDVATIQQRSKVPVTAGAQVSALIPQNIEQAFRVANAFAVSGLAPRSLNTPEAILVAIMAGAELGFAPYQAMQSFAVINGRASIWGDAIPALLWSRGFDIEEWFDDDDNATKAFCKITRPFTGKVIERTFSLKDAKLASLLGKEGPWQTAQKRMLRMRARAFCARDGAADVLRGMPVYEEVQDFQPLGHNGGPPLATGLAGRLAAGNKAPATEGFNAHHGQPEAQEASFTDRLSEVLDGDTIPNHDPETGEVIDELPADGPSPASATAEKEGRASADARPSDTDDFPGDKRSTAQGGGGANNVAPGGPSLSGRIAAFKKRALDATSATKLASIWAASAALRNDLDAADPDTVEATSGELETFTNELMARLETAERETRS